MKNNEEKKVKNTDDKFIPVVNDLFVPGKNFTELYDVIKSNKFYPVFVSGLSGNGKTFMVEQVCALLQREMMRINITIETDEDDLLGGFRLVDNSTVWFDGPVIHAMKRGSVLLMDEIDLASTKIMAMMPVLEGNGIYLKKINQFIEPQPGFNIIATANTKGQGSESGKFIGANFLNEAFLERFPATLEQEYPSIELEKEILFKVFCHNKINTSENDIFINALLKWAELIRNSHAQEAISDIISTRRLVHIANAYAMFGDKRKAIEVCINRFDYTTKMSFQQLYENCEERPEDEEDAKKNKKKNIPQNKDVDINSILGTEDIL